uniref:Uncharacterized protein n=1 Tax=Arundo donax TaxID=35708 RepID=A0A0A8YKV9_ARUDO
MPCANMSSHCFSTSSLRSWG